MGNNHLMDSPAMANQPMGNQATECHHHHPPCMEEGISSNQQAQPSSISITTMTMGHYAKCAEKRPPTSPERRWDASRGVGSAVCCGQPDSFAGSHVVWMAAKTLNSSVFHAIMSRLISRPTAADRYSNDHHNFILIYHFYCS